MTDKEKIKEEIEKLKNKQLSIFSKGESVEICGTALTCIGTYNQLLSFINSLPEEHNEDLEEAADQYALRDSQAYKGVHCTYVDDKIAFKAGAEWQKQQMVKDAVEGEVRKGYVGNQIIVHSKDGSAKYVAFDASYADAFCVGDKVKIIILKTE